MINHKFLSHKFCKFGHNLYDIAITDHRYQNFSFILALALT